MSIKYVSVAGTSYDIEDKNNVFSVSGSDLVIKSGTIVSNVNLQTSDSSLYITGSYNTIAGGQSNYIGNASGAGNSCFIGGGTGNAVDNEGTCEFIGGGFYNSISKYGYDSCNTITGGMNNYISGSGSCCVIVGGQQNNIYDTFNGFIGAGCNNNISEANGYAIIVGGESNINNGYCAFIGCGEYNNNSGYNTFIGGGCNNNISALYAIIVGGANNINNGSGAFIGGGYSNGVYNECCDYATIVGGAYNNISSGDANFIGGGFHNIIESGNKNNIIGGTCNYLNCASGTGDLCTIIGGQGTMVNSAVATMATNYFPGADFGSTSVSAAFYGRKGYTLKGLTSIPVDLQLGIPANAIVAISAMYAAKLYLADASGSQTGAAYRTGYIYGWQDGVDSPYWSMSEIAMDATPYWTDNSVLFLSGDSSNVITLCFNNYVQYSDYGIATSADVQLGIDYVVYGE